MVKLRVKVLYDLTVEEYLKMRDEGLRHSDIAKKRFVGTETLSRWIKKQKEMGNLPNEPQTIRLTIVNKLMNDDLYIRMRANGKSVQYIADKMGISKNSLTKWVRKEKNAGRLPELSYKSEWREWLNKSS